MKNSLITFVVAAATSLGSISAHSAPKKTPTVDTAAIGVGSPQQNKIWKYTYSPDIIFRIYTTTKRHTHLELGEDEGLAENPVIGDSLQWKVHGGPRNIYIKPLHDGIETSLTIVTSRRAYQFQLISPKEQEPAFQKISFDYPDRDAEIKLALDAKLTAVKTEESRLERQIISKSINPADLKFTYSISGNAPFRPETVYSDEKFTYLVMPNTQDMPAVFLVEDDGSLSQVKFKPRDNGNIVVVERLVKKLLLKLGEVEVLISRNEPKKSWW